MATRDFISSLVIVATLLGCGNGGEAQEEATEAAASPTTPPPSEFYLNADPPGAVRGSRYQGVLFSRDDPTASVFAAVTDITASSFREGALTDVEATRKDDATLFVSFNVAENANSTELLVLELAHAGGVSGARLYLRTVDRQWDGTPTAVAPPDTTVPDETSQVVLDASRSRHPAGRDAMDFTWFIDDSRMIKGDNTITITLSRGDHVVVLEAEDNFGNVSRDTMRVRVGP